MPASLAGAPGAVGPRPVRASRPHRATRTPTRLNCIRSWRCAGCSPCSRLLGAILHYGCRRRRWPCCNQGWIGNHRVVADESHCVFPRCASCSLIFCMFNKERGRWPLSFCGQVARTANRRLARCCCRHRPKSGRSRFRWPSLLLLHWARRPAGG